MERRAAVRRHGVLEARAARARDGTRPRPGPRRASPPSRHASRCSSSSGRDRLEQPELGPRGHERDEVEQPPAAPVEHGGAREHGVPHRLAAARLRPPPSTSVTKNALPRVSRWIALAVGSERRREHVHGFDRQARDRRAARRPAPRRAPRARPAADARRDLVVAVGRDHEPVGRRRSRRPTTRRTSSLAWSAQCTSSSTSTPARRSSSSSACADRPRIGARLDPLRELAARLGRDVDERAERRRRGQVLARAAEHAPARRRRRTLPRARSCRPRPHRRGTRASPGARAGSSCSSSSSRSRSGDRDGPHCALPRLREAEVDLGRGRVGPARGDDFAARVEVDPLGPVDVRSPKSDAFHPPNE